MGYKVTHVSVTGEATTVDTRTLQDAKDEAIERLRLGRDAALLDLIATSRRVAALAYTLQKSIGLQFMSAGELAAFEASATDIADRSATGKAAYQAATTIEDYDAVVWPD
jgi:hypothetical protein